MDTIITYIPTVYWIFALALTSAVLFTAMMLYLFNSRRIAAITGLEGSVADLTAKKTLLDSEIKIIEDHITAQKDELLRVSGEREMQEALRIELDTLTRRAQEMDSRNQELRDEVGRMDLERHNHNEQLRKMTEEMQALSRQRDQVEGQLQTLNEELSRGEKEIFQKLSDLEEAANKEAKHRIKEIENLLEQKQAAKLVKEQEYETLIEKLGEVKSQQQSALEKISEAEIRFQAIVSELSGKEASLSDLDGRIKHSQEQKEKLESEIEQLNQTIDEKKKLQEQLLEISTAVKQMEDNRQELIEKRQTLKEECASITENNKQISEELIHNTNDLAELKNSLKKYDKEYNRLIQVEDKKAEIEREVNRLEIEKAQLEDKLDGLRREMKQQNGTDSANNQQAFNDLLVEPVCLSNREFSDDPVPTDEIQALQRFQDNLEKEGIIFHKRVIYSFHTSLKCAAINPLTVLAGVSGTGKTLLPIKYAKLMGIHSLVMAVQPRWDSPQDMFGFYNYLEKRYKATDLARALVRMDEYNNFRQLNSAYKNRMLLVLMDEMNLARTEYYFSEFLSKLELRRDVKDPSIPSQRKDAEIVLDLGSEGTEASRLWVGENILFVGTMNEDETTQSLSDKVLDRSNVLRFGKPANRLTNDNIHFDEPLKLQGQLTHSHWKSWMNNPSGPSPWSENIANWTEKVNLALEKVGRPFGYRVEKAIRAYIDNYPGVGSGQIYKQAFADQIEQKILPKLRGLELSDSLTLECLGDMEMVIGELRDDQLSDAFQQAKEPNNIMFAWHGVSRH